MRAHDIEFVKLVGIEQSDNDVSLAFKKDVLNHIESIHASAQFTLAETQSGLFLQELFPQLVGKVVPMLRESKIKYKKPGKRYRWHFNCFIGVYMVCTKNIILG